MRFLKGMAVLLASAVLAACGGGKSTTGSTTPTGPTAATVELIASATYVDSSGTDQVTITAFVKDANNNAMTDTALAFSTDTGTLSSVETTTGTTGSATALFSAGNDHSNRTATITVTSGTITSQISLQIQGTQVKVSGPTTLALNTTADFTIVATDSKNNPIANAVLTVSSSIGNGLDKTSVTTDSSGQAAVKYTASKAGTDTLSVDGLGLSIPVTATLTITGEDFKFTNPDASLQVPEVVVGASQTLTVQYLKNNVAQAGATVNFAATVGSLSSSTAVTDASGVASVSISSTFAASSVVTATLAGNIAQATLPLNFVAKTPATLVLQVTPTALAPNPIGSTNNQSKVIATVRDSNGNPVSGATVNFSQDSDPSGGVLQSASAPTDLSGQATVQYLSGPNSTASNGVVLRGTVASTIGTGNVVTGTASLTVNQTALFIVLGTGNTITNFDTDTYQKTWTAIVTDANGVRVSGVQLTVKVLPTYFGKGYLAWNGKKWTYGAHLKCINEDVNQNGKLDAGEDTNGDGVLTPGNVVALQASTVTTDANGMAAITLRYPESFASWIDVRLTATAIVSGTESVTFKEFPLEVLSSDYTSETTPPAGVESPFGTDATTCFNAN